MLKYTSGLFQTLKHTFRGLLSFTNLHLEGISDLKPTLRGPL